MTTVLDPAQCVREIDVKFKNELTALKKIQSHFDGLNDMPSIGAKILKSDAKRLRVAKDKVDEAVEKLSRCIELKKEFRLVTLDPMTRKIPRPRNAGERKKTYEDAVQRFMNGEDDLPDEEPIVQTVKKKAIKRKRKPKPRLKLETIDVPLIWRATLPMKTKVSMKIRGNRGNSIVGTQYILEANTPNPTVEAVSLINENQGRFDHFDIWWVPKNIEVKKEPLPKPQVKPDPILVGVIKIANVDTYYFELTRWIDETVETGWWSREAY